MRGVESMSGRDSPANTRRWTNVGLMLGQRRRRWANINTTLVQCLVFAGISHYQPVLVNTTQQTRYWTRSIKAMLHSCWATFPTLNHNWLNVWSISLVWCIVFAHLHRDVSQRYTVCQLSAHFFIDIAMTF